jgi:hypothetical protein
MARITTPREGSRADPWPPPAPIAAPLRPHETHVRHLGEARLVSG